jgi:hypothetical protein
MRDGVVKLENNMKVDFNKLQCGRLNWIQMAQHRIQWLAIVHTKIHFQLNT